MKRTGLVLYSFKSHKRGYIENLFSLLSDRAAQHEINLERSALKELHIKVCSGELIIIDPISGKDLKEFAIVYFELWYKCPQQALAVAQYCSRTKVPYFSTELARVMPDTKVGEIASLADSGISIPDTFTTSRSQFKRVFAKQSTTQPFDYPFILKAADGYGGNNNFLIEDYIQLVTALDKHIQVTFIAQEFIPNDCDYRCLIMGGEITLVINRSRNTSETHLNNTSAGAEGVVVPKEALSKQARRDVLHAAKLLNREQFAGVDLIVDKNTGQHYVLEVNQTPQIEIGVEVEAKMDTLLSYMKQLGGDRW